jgi:pimeloyl-ACP methyl ester carboxylesterase
MTRWPLLFLLAMSCTTDATRRGYLERSALELPPPPRPVIIIPGFGLTRLFDPVTQRFVWGTAHATVQTRFADDLDLPAEGRDRLVPRGYAGSRGPLNTGWHLSEALRKYGGYTPGENLHPFYYDWRLSARDNAERLGELADRIRGNGRVDIVTHSAGAIVALTYVKLGRGRDAVDHLIMIAPTERGVADAFRILVRPERFLRRVFSSDIVATWPSVLELLPEDGRFLVNPDGTSVEFDAWNRESWRRFGRSEPSFGKLLESARRFRDELRTSAIPQQVKVTVLAGDCVPTAKRVLSRPDGSFVFYRSELRENEKSLAKTLFEPGDGTVPISSAGAEGDVLLFCDGHQGLAADPNVHRALIRIVFGER